MNDSKQRIDLLAEILESHVHNDDVLAEIREHFVLVPIQDLPEPVKQEHEWGAEYMIGGFLYQPKYLIDPEQTWGFVLDQIAALRFHHGEEMAKHALNKRRDELAQEFSEGNQFYGTVGDSLRKAIDRIIEQENQ